MATDSLAKSDSEGLADIEMKEKKESSNPWEEYEDSKFDSPGFNRWCCFSSPGFYKCRWKLASCFHTRLCCGIVLGEIVFLVLILSFFAGNIVMKGFGKKIVHDTGSLAGMPATLSFAFACRNSVWIVLTGLPFERALKWHKLFAYISVGIGIWHGYLAVIMMKEWDITGTVLTAAMAALLLFSFWPIRRKLFESFYRIHWILILITIGFAMLHGVSTMGPGVMLFIFDFFLRTYMIYGSSPKKAFCVRLPSNIIKLTWKKGNWNYKAGQYVFLRVPGVAKFEYHPFSISSSPHEDTVSIHIRVLGDWTKKLYDFASESRDIDVNVDGPYGAPCLDIDGSKYTHFLFVSGGIGITPMQSICNDIMHQHKRGRELNKVMFIWSVRDLYMVESVLEYDKEYIKKTHQKKLPTSFSPDLLNRNVDRQVMETYFHLTQERDPSKFGEANINPELQSDMKFGRPQIPDLFDKMKEYCQLDNPKGRVAVMTCGPAGLVKCVEKLCVKNSSFGGVTFDFHKELFEF